MLFKKSITFGRRKIGDGEPCFIVFEAGPTHSGIESAKMLAAHAAEAGADAVKFQVVNADRLVADRMQMFSFEILTDRSTDARKTISRPLYDLLKERSLTFAEWRELKSFCDDLGLAFFATAGFEDEIEFLVDLGCDSIKIASADVNHLPLIKKAAQTGVCLQLDTGNSTLGEIETAVDVIVAQGNTDVVIHQCPSGYPARLESVNLRVIPTLKQMFGFPVAYSDHVPGWEIDVAAVAMGANLVEKTITLDRTTPSVEHIMSIEPQDMAHFVRTIRNIEVAMGSSRRFMSEDEVEKRKSVRRSMFLMEDAVKGTKLGDLSVEFRRPGFGVGPDLYDRLVDKKLRISVKAGHLLKFDDLDFG